MKLDFDPAKAVADERELYLSVRMNATHEMHGGEGFAVLGGVEVMLLWESLSSSFVSGNWIAVVLSAQAMCERGLADLYSLHDLPGVQSSGRRDWENAALGKLLNWAREDGDVPPDVLDKIQILCDRRKVLTHWKRPLESGTIMSRIVELVRRDDDDVRDFYEIQDALLAQDAMDAMDAVFEFCFGNQMLMLKWRGR